MKDHYQHLNPFASLSGHVEGRCDACRHDLSRDWPDLSSVCPRFSYKRYNDSEWEWDKGVQAGCSFCSLISDVFWDACGRFIGMPDDSDWPSGCYVRRRVGIRLQSTTSGRYLLFLSNIGMPAPQIGGLPDSRTWKTGYIHVCFDGKSLS